MLTSFFERRDYDKTEYCWKDTTIYGKVGNIGKIVSSKGCLSLTFVSGLVWKANLKHK